MRYVIEGILNDVADGKDIVIVSPRLRYSDDLLKQVVDSVDREQWSNVCRSNGNQSVVHVNGGTARAVAATASLRGRRIDVLLVLEPRAMSEDQLAEIRYAARSSTTLETQLLS